MDETETETMGASQTSSPESPASPTSPTCESMESPESMALVVHEPHEAVVHRLGRHEETGAPMSAMNWLSLQHDLPQDISAEDMFQLLTKPEFVERFERRKAEQRQIDGLSPDKDAEYTLRNQHFLLKKKLPMLMEHRENTKRDVRVMRGMLERVNNTCPDDEEALLDTLRELVKIQFQLQPYTRHRLARAVRSVDGDWIVDTGFTTASEPTSLTEGIAKFVASAAWCKIAQLLMGGDDRSLQLFVDFWKDISTPTRSRTRESRRERREHLQQIRQNDTSMRKMMRVMEKGKHIIPEDVQKEAEELVERHEKIKQSTKETEDSMRDARQLLGVDLRDPALIPRMFPFFIGIFGMLRKLPAPEALRLPHTYRMSLSTCLKIIDEAFPLPKQMLGKIEFFISAGFADAEHFRPIETKIVRFQEDMLAGGDLLLAIEYAFDHAEDLIALNREIETYKDSAMKKEKAERKKNRRTSSASQPLSPMLVAARPCSPPPASPPPSPPLYKPGSQITPLLRTPAANVANAFGMASNGATFFVRRVFAPGNIWSFRTSLSEAELKRRLKRDMDVGTFESVMHSAAYHVQKHAPHMLIEDYLDAARVAFERLWVGEVAPRLRNPYGYLGGASVGESGADGEERAFVKVVRGPAGDGRFGWDGRVIWFQPPVA